MQLSYMLNVSYQEENVDLGEAKKKKKKEWGMDGGRGGVLWQLNIMLGVVLWEIYFKWS